MEISHAPLRACTRADARVVPGGERWAGPWRRSAGVYWGFAVIAVIAQSHPPPQAV